jgi:hypothetical protein
MTRSLPLALVALASVTFTALPVAAQSGGAIRHSPAQVAEFVSRCKAAPHTTHSTISAQDARDRWTGHVRSLHGPHWSLWSAAADTSQHTYQQAGGSVHVVSGRPCLRLGAALAP